MKPPRGVNERLEAKSLFNLWCAREHAPPPKLCPGRRQCAYDWGRYLMTIQQMRARKPVRSLSIPPRERCCSPSQGEHSHRRCILHWRYEAYREEGIALFEGLLKTH